MTVDDKYQTESRLPEWPRQVSDQTEKEEPGGYDDVIQR